MNIYMNITNKPCDQIGDTYQHEVRDKMSAVRRILAVLFGCEDVITQ